jgi:hypothetical protein
LTSRNPQDFFAGDDRMLLDVAPIPSVPGDVEEIIGIVGLIRVDRLKRNLLVGGLVSWGSLP